MTSRRRFMAWTGERGFALVYTAVTLTTLLLFTGLAVDTGRAYLVKAQLTKAVDGAALGAARLLNSGDPRTEAGRIFEANFPEGYLGVTSVTDPTEPSFFELETIDETGANVVTVTAEATLPTTFMRLASFTEVTVRSSGEARRRMVDLSLVLDVSGSIGSSWPQVRDAARDFVSAFDEDSDRMALVTYGSGARVLNQMQADRGFDKDEFINDIPNALPGGSTAMVEGLYRGWDELRTVPAGSQSGLRVIVLFTDGASNVVPGRYTVNGVALAQARGLRTSDFPKNWPDPDNMTWDSPAIQGMYHTVTGAVNPGTGSISRPWDSPLPHAAVPWMPNPAVSTHEAPRSVGIPTSFPLQSATLTVDGVSQQTVRGLRNWNAANGYPAEIFNINNSARNLVEIIADAARSDPDGDYPIRIYTIGMGALVQYNLGTIPETSESILQRVANDPVSPDFNDAQSEGKYYFAQTAADVGPAFQALQSEIVRLSK